MGSPGSTALDSMPRHTLPGAVGRLSAAPPRAGTVACSVCLLVLLVCLSAWVAECGAQSQSVGSGSGVGNDTQCRDKGNGKWHSSTRGTCKRLVQLDYCTKDGKRGAKWIPKWGNVSHWANQDVFYGGPAGIVGVTCVPVEQTVRIVRALNTCPSKNTF